MRINRFLALATGMSRRSADKVMEWGRVKVNGQPAPTGYDVQPGDKVTLDDQPITVAENFTTILLNKPAGYVVSRDGQGSRSIYELLPKELHHLKAVGRLDKASSGLLLLTNDGELANQLTHPSHQKEKVYDIELYIPLKPQDQEQIEQGVELEDGLSRLGLVGKDKHWKVTMSEGRNRQIRRTFAALGYTVAALHRSRFGDYQLDDVAPGKYRKINEV